MSFCPHPSLPDYLCAHKQQGFAFYPSVSSCTSPHPRRLPFQTTTPTLGVCRASIVTPSTSSDRPTPLTPPSIPHLRWGLSKEQGPRESMEDIIQVVPTGACGFFFATVYDGHSGIAAARYLEQNLYRVFGEMLDMHALGLDNRLSIDDEGLSCPLELHDVLTDCYRQSDTALLRWLSAQPDGEADSGCTATTALIRSDRIIVANVGDSRAILCRKGHSVDLSTEHRVYGRGPMVAEEIKRVEAGGGWVDDGRVCGVLAVSRAFGDADFKAPHLERLLKRGVEDGHWDEAFASTIRFTADPVTSEPDVFEMTTEAGDDEFVVVATDGLWDVLSSQEVASLVRSDLRKGKSPEEVAHRLTQVAVKRSTWDNTSVIVIDLLGEEGWKGHGPTKKKGLFGLF